MPDVDEGGEGEPNVNQHGEPARMLSLIGPLRLRVAARVADRDAVDDIVQETLSRVLQTRDRLADEALLSYALAVARNLIASGERRRHVAQRNAARLVDLQAPADPLETVLRAEEAEAVRAALPAMPERERELLIAHEVRGVGTRALAQAQSSSSTPGGVAARLARARARLRVEYLLAFRRVTVPTAMCRPVLLALSAGDQRRQRALAAGTHLVSCSTCADLSEPLLTRRRALAGVVPAGMLIPLARRQAPRPNGRVVQQVAAGVAVAGAVAAVVVVSTTTGESGRAAPAPAPLVVGSGHSALSRATLATAERSGQQVSADDATVLAVPADEGFWIGNGGSRLWVRLIGPEESSFRVRPGQRLTFEAQLSRRTRGVHLQVAAGALMRPVAVD